MPFPDLADRSVCTACLACVASCRVGALSMYMEIDGHTYVSVDEDACVGCHSCEVACRDSLTSHGNSELSLSSPFVAWANNEEDRRKGTSGGIFAACARSVIRSGGTAVGARIDGFDCNYVAIDNERDIGILQGSKYLASNMSGIYETVDSALARGDVVFSGLPCHCAGIISHFEGRAVRGKLYTIDLVCGGVPSHILVDKFREEMPRVDGLVSFRDKDAYRLVVSENETDKDIKDKNLILNGFSCGMTNRLCCYDCKFAHAHRRTDITIGDLWNYHLFPEEHAKGISTVIVHTKQGFDLLRASDVFSQPIAWADILQTNMRIVCGRQVLYRPRLNLASAARTMSLQSFKKLYCVTMKPSDFGQFTFRVYRYVREKLLRARHHVYINILCRRSRYA